MTANFDFYITRKNEPPSTAERAEIFKGCFGKLVKRNKVVHIASEEASSFDNMVKPAPASAKIAPIFHLLCLFLDCSNDFPVSDKYLTASKQKVANDFPEQGSDSLGALSGKELFLSIFFLSQFSKIASYKPHPSCLFDRCWKSRNVKEDQFLFDCLIHKTIYHENLVCLGRATMMTESHNTWEIVHLHIICWWSWRRSNWHPTARRFSESLSTPQSISPLFTFPLYRA